MRSSPFVGAAWLALVLVFVASLASSSFARQGDGAQPTGAELAGALWVEGRVVLPAGIPADELLRVVARGRGFDHGALHSAVLASDGSFRVAFHPKTRRGRVELSARYLYLDEPVVVAPQNPQPLVLEPALGARVVGRCALAESLRARRERLVGTKVQLLAFQDAHGLGKLTEREARLDAELRFEIGGVPPGTESHLTVAPAAARAEQLAIPRLAAGATHEIGIDLAAGITVRGRVVDEHGNGVANVEIALASAADTPRGLAELVLDASDTRMKSGKDGSFVLTGVHFGAWRIGARVRGYAWSSQLVPAAGDGEVVELTVRLERGPTIRGRVLGADGAPASRARVEVRRIDEARWDDVDFASFSDDDEPIRAEKDGTFLASGLRDGVYRVVARAGAGLESAPVDVRPGGAPVELALHAPIAVKGRVVDDAGAPIQEFRVRALRAGDERIELEIEDADGRFELRLPVGTWRVVAGDDAGMSNAVTLALPGADAPLELRILRRSQVRGRVVDPFGRPVAQTEVEWLTNPDESAPELDGDLVAGLDRVPLHRSTWTDGDGRFAFDDVPAGTICFVASSTEWCASPHVKIAVAPGVAVPEIELALRRGGHVEFEVLDPAGAPAADWRVYFEPYEDHVKSFPLDRDGRVRTRKLAPGTYDVSARHQDARDVEAPDAGWSRKVEVVADQTTTVRFGPAASAPVVVRGLVLAGGAPVDGAAVDAARYADNPDFAARTRTSGADGRFEMPLDRGGLYAWTVTTGGTESLRFARVPDSGSVELTFDVGAGSIAGTLRAPDGAPLANQTVAVQPDRDAADRTRWWTTSSARTGADGRFAFAHLSPGTYRVALEAEGPYAATCVEGVAVRDGAATDVVLQVARACVVRGIVRDERGAPAANVGVFACDARGVHARTDALDRTDTSGRFEIAGLPPGPTIVYARDGGRATFESDVVALAPDGSADVELRLVAATRVYVGVKDADGRWVERAQVRIRDESGRDRNAASTRGAPGGERQGGLEAVLPPGSYRVVVRDELGREATSSIRTNGEPTAYVEVRLGA